MKSRKELYKYAKDKNVSLKSLQKLLIYGLKISKEELFFIETLTNKEYEIITKYVDQLASGYPIAYIIGTADFYGQEFYVNDKVLIPRYDTEVLVKAVLEVKDISKYFLIDIGTGSGIIPITILNNSSISSAYAVDISKDALEVARINKDNLILKKNLTFFQSDLLESFLDQECQNIRAKHIIITANLPYVKDYDYGNMQSETYNFEPTLALYGGKQDGFDLYRKLFQQIFEFGKKFDIKKILTFIEIGFDQLEIAKKVISEHGLTYTIYYDSFHRARVMKIIFLF